MLRVRDWSALSPSAYAFLSVFALWFHTNAAVFRGLVMDAVNKSPVENAQLELFASVTDSTPRFTGISRSDGSFAYDSLPDGRYWLRVKGGSYVAQWYAPNSGTTRYAQYGFYLGAATEFVSIELRATPIDNPPASILRVLVRDSSGAPAQSGVIQLQNEKDSYTAAKADLANGLALFSGIQPGTYTVFLQCPPYPPQYYDPSRNSTTPRFYVPVQPYDTLTIPVTMTTQPVGNARITGKTMTMTGQLAPEVSVALFAGSDLTSPRYQTVSDGAGIFRFEQIIEQGYFLQLSSGTSYPPQWYSPQRKATTRYPDDPLYPVPTSDTLFITLSTVPIENAPSSVIYVVPFDPAGKPIGSSTGKIECVDRLHLSFKTLSYDAASARYRIDGLKAGEYSLRFEFPPFPVQYYAPDGMTAQEVYYQPVRDKDTIFLEARLKSTFGPIDTGVRETGFDGRVTATLGNPVRGARVLAIPSNQRVWTEFNPSRLWSALATTTDSAGYYRFRGIPWDDYIVAVVADSQNFVTQFFMNADLPAYAKVVRIDSLNRPTLNMVLRPGGQVSGTVKTMQGAPLAGVTVHLREKNGPRWFETISDQGGSYRIIGVPAGLWNVWLHHPDYLRRDTQPMAPDVSIAEGTTLTLPLVTMEAGGRIAGTYRASFALSELLGTTASGGEWFVGNLLLYPDSLVARETMLYPAYTTGVRLSPDMMGSSSGSFITDVCPAGTWRAVFSPVGRFESNDTFVLSPPVRPGLAWQVVGGDTVLDAGTLIVTKPFDTAKNVALSIQRGYGVSGMVRDSTGTVLYSYHLSALVRSADRYFCVAHSERPTPMAFLFSGLRQKQEYYIAAWADGYPNQFWSPETTTAVPSKPVRFDSTVGSPWQVTIRRLARDSGVTPSLQPISLSGKFAPDGTLKSLAWKIDPRYPFDTCYLFIKVRDSATRSIGVFPIQQGVLDYSQTVVPFFSAPVRYLAVASGKGFKARSNELYVDPRNIGFGRDSLWIVVSGTRWGIGIEWGPPSMVEGDSVSLFRRIEGSSWTLIDRRPAWNIIMEDHAWKREDSGKTFEYRVELLATRAVSRIAGFRLDADFFSRLAQPLYVGPYEKYLTIQSAIDAAENDAMIVARSGTYRENIDFKGKSLQLTADWQFGRPPVIDGGGGIAVTVPWTVVRGGSSYPRVSGFKITNAITGISTAVPLIVSECLFTNVTRGVEITVDSAAMTAALRSEPFVDTKIGVSIDQCTFIANRLGSVVAVAGARGIAESPGAAPLPQGYERFFMTPVYSLSSSLRIANTIMAHYISVGGTAELPIKLGGVTPGALISNSNFWNTSTTVATPRIRYENRVLTIDPCFTDTLYCFLPETSPLRTVATDRRVIGYDGRRFGKDTPDEERGGLAPVRNVVVRQIGLRRALVTWSASPDSEKVVHYVVSRCPGDTGMYYVNQQQQWQPRLPDSLFMGLVSRFFTTGISFVDSSLAPGVPYLYLVTAVDTAGRESDVDFPAVVPLSQFIINRFRYSVALKGQQWHMISLWGGDTVATPSANSATIFHWDDARTKDSLYAQYSTPRALVPGKGYWIRPERDTLLTVQQTTLVTLAAMEHGLAVALKAGRTGWNQISSPLPFPLAPQWLDSVALWEWYPDSMGYARATALEPWKAYWVHTTVDKVLPLRSDRTVARRAGGEALWQIRLSLRGKEVYDPDNYLGVSAGTHREEPEPPAGFGGGRLYFIGKDGTSPCAAILTTPDTGRVEWCWTLTPSAQATCVTVGGRNAIPQSWHVFWIERSRVIDLRTDSIINIAPHAQALQGFMLVTANKRDIALFNGKTAFTSSWPNPFYRAVTLSYVVPYDWQYTETSRRVCIAIYDISGKKRKTLFEGNRVPGIYRINWTGDDDAGAETRSGVYIARLSIGRQHATTRIFKVR